MRKEWNGGLPTQTPPMSKRMAFGGVLGGIVMLVEGSLGAMRVSLC